MKAMDKSKHISNENGGKSREIKGCLFKVVDGNQFIWKRAASQPSSECIAINNNAV